MKADYFYLPLLLLATLGLWLPRLSGPIDLRYDAGAYYILGTSLAEGKGYRLLNEPGEIQAVQYPPLLPAVVAVHELLLGTAAPDVVGRALRATYFAISLLHAAATYLLARRYLAPGFALVAGLITSFYMHTILLSDMLFAEVPFALATVLLVLAAGCRGRLAAVAGGILAAAAYLLRTAGIAVLAAWVGAALLERRWRAAAARAAMALVPFLAWQGYIRGVKAGPEYARPAYTYQRAPYQYSNVTYEENALLVDSFAPERGQVTAADLAARAARNAGYLALGVGEGVSAERGYWVWLWRRAQRRILGKVYLADGAAGAFVLLLSALVAAGLVVLALRGEFLVPLYVVLGVGLMCLTPWQGQFSRYMAPLTPFLAIALLRALASIQERARRSWSRPRRLAAAGGVFLVITAAFAAQAEAAWYAWNRFHDDEPVRWGNDAGPAQRLLFHDEAETAYHAAVLWLKDHAAPGDIIAASAPYWVYLHTGRQSVLPPMEIDVQRCQELLDSVPARFVIIDNLEFTRGAPSISRYARAAIESHPEAWRLAHEHPGGRARVYSRTQ